MKQTDFVGNLPPEPPRKDIRNTRPSVAEEKARLALELGRLLMAVPPEVRSGSINAVNRWKQVREAASKVAGAKRSSVQDLQYAIRSMQNWKEPLKPAPIAAGIG